MSLIQSRNYILSNNIETGGLRTAEGKKLRLLTRSDFDGIVCAILLIELNLINEIKFVHPKDVQDGKIDITGDDITTNLPYVNSACLAFDHHHSEIIRSNGRNSNHIIDPDAHSASRVVYNYYGGPKKFPNISEEMLSAVDKADWAQYTMEDVLNPTGWELLAFIMDPRTGLGRFKDFRIPNFDLMLHLVDYIKNHPIDKILENPDVRERVDLFFKHQEKSKEQIKRCSTEYKNLVILNLRNEDVIYAGNRFMIYALFPQCNISMHAIWGYQKQNTVFAVGKSIFNRTSNTNIGELMSKYGGGGHKNAGTCQIDNDKADQVMKELIKHINDDG